MHSCAAPTAWIAAVGSQPVQTWSRTTKHHCCWAALDEGRSVCYGSDYKSGSRLPVTGFVPVSGSLLPLSGSDAVDQYGWRL